MAKQDKNARLEPLLRGWKRDVETTPVQNGPTTKEAQDAIEKGKSKND